mgnify:CR=1 FL=1
MAIQLTSGSGGAWTGPLQFSGKGQIYGMRLSKYLPRMGEVDHRLILGLDQRAYINDCSIAGLPAGALQRETVIDETRRAYRLVLDGLSVPADALITGDAALAALAAMRTVAWLLISAECAGGMAGALDVIVDYLNTRTTFGRKIGSYLMWTAMATTCVTSSMFLTALAPNLLAIAVGDDVEKHASRG